MQLTYYKWPMIIFFAGLFVRVIGFLMKILHWKGADIIYPGGLVIIGIGIVVFLIKLYSKKNN